MSRPSATRPLNRAERVLAMAASGFITTVDVQRCLPTTTPSKAVHEAKVLAGKLGREWIQRPRRGTALQEFYSPDRVKAGEQGGFIF